jgi:hypothetical protein
MKGQLLLFGELMVSGYLLQDSFYILQHIFSFVRKHAHSISFCHPSSHRMFGGCTDFGYANCLGEASFELGRVAYASLFR